MPIQVNHYINPAQLTLKEIIEKNEFIDVFYTIFTWVKSSFSKRANKSMLIIFLPYE